MPTVPLIHQRGTRAAQPAATAVTVGTLYFVTDEGVTERSTGAAWESYSGGPGALGFYELTGDVTAGPGVGTQAATIAAGTVTYAKLQAVSAASRLLGRGSASGAGAVEEITLGTNLALAGTTLNATGGGGAPAAHASTHDTGGADPITALSGSVITTGTLASARLATPQKTRTITFVFGNGTAAITAGLRTYVSCPYMGTITAARLLAVDAAVTSGSIVLDVWKDTYANFPPTLADSITASAKPTLSSATTSEDTTLTGWTTAVTAGDVFAGTVDSASTVTQVALQLTLVVS